MAATEGLFCATGPAYDMVRIGLGFYGDLGVDIRPAPELAALAAELRPAMTVGARPARLEWMPAGSPIGYGGEWVAERPSRIATLPIGYADGWTRRYWPGASALVRGRRFPLVGRVSMDSVCVDVTDAGEIGYDEPFVLLGRQGDGADHRRSSWHACAAPSRTRSSARSARGSNAASWRRRLHGPADAAVPFGVG